MRCCVAAGWSGAGFRYTLPGLPGGNDGSGGPGYTIKAEFNDIPHDRGILSMARSQDPSSAGSQFFIVVQDTYRDKPQEFLQNLDTEEKRWVAVVRNLDFKYTIFGKVVKGMEVADKIVSAPRDSRDNPNVRIEMKVRIENR